MGRLQEAKIQDIYQQCRFRNSRNESGELSFLPFNLSQRMIAALPLLDLDTDEIITVGDVAENR